MAVTAAQAAAIELAVLQYTGAREEAATRLYQSQLATWWLFLGTAGVTVQALAAGRQGTAVANAAALAALTEPPDAATLPQAAVDALYDANAVAALARVWALKSSAAQAQSAALASTFQSRVLGHLGLRARARPVTLPPLPRQVPPDVVWSRPVEQARYARSIGQELPDALQVAEQRVADLVESDLRLAERLATRDVLNAAGTRVTGYRRVLRPELSRTGTCGLCVAAADRVYSTGTLLPIHEHCRCVVLPITSGEDPGSALNQVDLERLYTAAGSTAAADLKRVRVKVTEHGELGPVLAPARRTTRDPEQVAAARRRGTPVTRDPRNIPAEAAALERNIPLLEARLAAGEDVAGPLAWQRKRLAEYRRELAA